MSGVSEFIINFADTKRSPVLFFMEKYSVTDWLPILVARCNFAGGIVSMWCFSRAMLM